MKKNKIFALVAVFVVIGISFLINNSYSGGAYKVEISPNLVPEKIDPNGDIKVTTSGPDDKLTESNNVTTTTEETNLTEIKEEPIEVAEYIDNNFVPPCVYNVYNTTNTTIIYNVTQTSVVSSIQPKVVEIVPTTVVLVIPITTCDNDIFTHNNTSKYELKNIVSKHEISLKNLIEKKEKFPVRQNFTLDHANNVTCIGGPCNSTLKKLQISFVELFAFFDNSSNSGKESAFQEIKEKIIGIKDKINDSGIARSTLDAWEKVIKNRSKLEFLTSFNKAHKIVEEKWEKEHKSHTCKDVSYAILIGPNPDHRTVLWNRIQNFVINEL